MDLKNFAFQNFDQIEAATDEELRKFVAEHADFTEASLNALHREALEDAAFAVIEPYIPKQQTSPLAWVTQQSQKLAEANEKAREKTPESGDAGAHEADKGKGTPRAPSGKSAVLSASASRSWTDQSVKNARSTRHGVSCRDAGIGIWAEYNSVADAFRKLKLPFNKHIAFRGELKKAGALTFQCEGRSVEFRLVVLEKKASQ